MALLGTPIKLKNLAFSNRLVMPPMATAKSNENGEVSQELCDYYAEKSKGGYIGLIITEHSYISPEGKARKGQLSISRDTDIDGLKKLVSSIHQNDTKVVAQINHAGGRAIGEITGSEAISASAVKIPSSVITENIPKEMTQQDIEIVVNAFAQAARRAKEAGFDGVEIHSAHAYLLNQFYSPLVNKRTDEYNGNSIAGRIQLHLEIIKAIRNTVGNDYLVALRFGASDYMDGGSTLEDSISAAKAFENAGVDLLDISGGLCLYHRLGTNEQGYFSELTEAIKKNVAIPIILTGGIVDVEVAERLLENNKADLIGVGRAISKDSEWAKRAITSLKQ